MPQKLLLALLLLAPVAFAIEEIRFAEKDWQFACDDIACHVKGQQSQTSPHPFAIYLTPSTAEKETMDVIFTIGSINDSPLPDILEWHIIQQDEDKNMGDLHFYYRLDGKIIANLNAEQGEALITALKTDITRITLHNAHNQKFRVTQTSNDIKQGITEETPIISSDKNPVWAEISTAGARTVLQKASDYLPENASAY